MGRSRISELFLAAMEEELVSLLSAFSCCRIRLPRTRVRLHRSRSFVYRRSLPGSWHSDLFRQASALAQDRQTTEPLLLLLLFMIWGAIRTIPFLDTYGVDALRDAVLWGYGLFALIVATRMIAREDYFGLVLHAFYKFSKFYLLACPLIWAYNVYLIQRMPHFFYGKTTRFEEVLVWLGAIAAIMFSRVFNYSPFWIILLCSDTILFFTGNRAGMLAFVCVVILCWLTNPFSRRLWLAAALAGITLLVLALLDVRIDMSHRELSIQQLVTNIESTFSSAQQSNEQGTKEWRLAWWRQIVDYTVFGEFFWGGKGFGVNLSDDDNHKLDYGRGPNQLRSPHSSHLSVLAARGRPGIFTLDHHESDLGSASVLPSHSRQGGRTAAVGRFDFASPQFLAWHFRHHVFWRCFGRSHDGHTVLDRLWHGHRCTLCIQEDAVPAGWDFRAYAGSRARSF